MDDPQGARHTAPFWMHQINMGLEEESGDEIDFDAYYSQADAAAAAPLPVHTDASPPRTRGTYDYDLRERRFPDVQLVADRPLWAAGMQGRWRGIVTELDDDEVTVRWSNRPFVVVAVAALYELHDALSDGVLTFAGRSAARAAEICRGAPRRTPTAAAVAFVNRLEERVARAASNAGMSSVAWLQCFASGTEWSNRAVSALPELVHAVPITTNAVRRHPACRSLLAALPSSTAAVRVVHHKKTTPLRIQRGVVEAVRGARSLCRLLIAHGDAVVSTGDTVFVAGYRMRVVRTIGSREYDVRVMRKCRMDDVVHDVLDQPFYVRS